MTPPRERPHVTSADGVLGRLTTHALAWFLAGCVVATALPTVLTPLPMPQLTPMPERVVARTSPVAAPAGGPRP